MTVAWRVGRKADPRVVSTARQSAVRMAEPTVVQKAAQTVDPLAGRTAASSVGQRAWLMVES